MITSNNICKKYGVSFSILNIAKNMLAKDILTGHKELRVEVSRFLPAESIDIVGADDLLFHLRRDVRKKYLVSQPPPFNWGFMGS